jgi:hypothetical protein
MKIRIGFVSNSSSSSFVCSICGDSYSGYDGQYEVKHYECQNGHEICGDCSDDINILIKKLSEDVNYAIKKLELTDAEANELIGAEDKYDCINEWVHFDGLDSSVCPICVLTHVPDYVKLRYVLEKFDLSEKDICDEIREKYTNLKAWENRNEN